MAVSRIRSDGWVRGSIKNIQNKIAKRQKRERAKARVRYLPFLFSGYLANRKGLAPRQKCSL